MINAFEELMKNASSASKQSPTKKRKLNSVTASFKKSELPSNDINNGKKQKSFTRHKTICDIIDLEEEFEVQKSTVEFSANNQMEKPISPKDRLDPQSISPERVTNLPQNEIVDDEVEITSERKGIKFPTTKSTLNIKQTLIKPISNKKCRFHLQLDEHNKWQFQLSIDEDSKFDNVVFDEKSILKKLDTACDCEIRLTTNYMNSNPIDYNQPDVRINYPSKEMTKCYLSPSNLKRFIGDCKLISHISIYFLVHSKKTCD